MEIASGLAAQLAQTRSDLATNAVKQSAEADQEIADLLQDSLQSAASSIPGSPIRGTNVNIKV